MQVRVRPLKSLEFHDQYCGTDLTVKMPWMMPLKRYLGLDHKMDRICNNRQYHVSYNTALAEDMIKPDIFLKA